MLVDNSEIRDLVFTDDALIFGESLKVMIMNLEALHKEVKALGLQVFWTEMKIQVFGSLMIETVPSVYVYGKVIEISESFTYLVSVVCNDGGSS